MNLAIPGQSRISVQQIPGPLAAPASFALPNGGGVSLFIVGGVSAYEQAVMQVAAQLARPGLDYDYVAAQAIAVVDAVQKALKEKEAASERLSS